MPSEIKIESIFYKWSHIFLFKVLYLLIIADKAISKNGVIRVDKKGENFAFDPNVFIKLETK